MLIVTLFLMLLGKKITLKNRILISQSMNVNSLEGLVRLTRKIFKYTFTFEIIGALLIATEFVPQYGFSLGLFKSLFQSISAFCNAGFDLVGDSSLIPFATHKIINIVCMLLTTIGGLGFLVWDDISKCVKNKFQLKKLSLHTKLVLMMQLILVIVGAILFFGFEFNNDLTIAKFSLPDKILISLFHSVSARTAGFATVNLAFCNDITKLIISLLMFIGAGSGGMAGGVKTTTFFILIMGVISNIAGKKNINVFKNTISTNTFIKSVTIVMIALTVLLFAICIMMINSNIYIVDIIFEVISALSTTGLTSGALVQMNLLCKSLIILLMYTGRLGTLTMALAFVLKKPKENDLVVYAEGNVIVG